MTSTKLSEAEKREILELYQNPEETTITLAKRYGVSSSTVRRILQGGYSEEEYETIVQQKRVLRLSDNISQSIDPEAEESEWTPSSLQLEGSTFESPQDPKRRRKRSSSAASTLSEGVVKRGLIKKKSSEEAAPEEEGEILAEDYEAQSSNLKEMLGEELLEEEEELDDFEDDLEDFSDEDLEDEDSLDEEAEPRYGTYVYTRSKSQFQVLPLSEASLPKICYLVVDRAAELVTRPLKAFGELGHIPPEEVQERTLPVFDNHRVARRFSARNQRICKIPDGKMIQKLAPYLQEKGITRLLVDGQVYRL